MTAKEKAIWLVSNYFYLITNLPFKETWIEIHWNDYKKSKECALIAVEEILNNSVMNYSGSDFSNNEILSDIDYWNEVKKEIELL